MTRRPRRDPAFLRPGAPTPLQRAGRHSAFGSGRRRRVDEIRFGAPRAWRARSRRRDHARRRRTALAVLLACALIPVLLLATRSGGELEAPSSEPTSAEGTVSPARADPLTPRSLTGTGSLATVSGASDPLGPEPVTRFGVEVENGLRIDQRAFARAVEHTLLDRRSWAARGGFGLQRVDAGPVDFSVVLAEPDTTDELCAPLETNGRYSCYMDGRAVLNARRWASGASSYRGQLGRYRRYVVNHEVGHALGHGHVGCPAAGEPAPVMVQQTKGLEGCRANPWPLAAEL